ncbi:MAG TPA: T9SS type A sorting domain-containing protein [Bacteroidia bacterium]|nr:T9SS type A sorting domain-containing protein [Bacteroidia bacterium]
MKKIYLSVAAALAISSAATAQCSGRYAVDVYSVTTTTAITYGSNLDYTGNPTTLTLDFYEPTADTSTARPLIIWAHGGSFISGTSADVDVASLSNHFAKKGYVCASINYRKGVSSFDSVGLNQAVVRAVQDMKASIRFFYKDRATANTYKIDTNKIFIGGSSAGAITALHTEYLDKACKIYPYVDSTTLAGLGGLNGASGNAGYSTKVKGVIDLCGGLGVYAWLEAGNTPLCSMHGTADATVPYSRGIVNPGIPIQYIDGSRMIYKRALCVGVPDNFYTWENAPHVPYAGTSATQLAYMDTTVNFVRDYLLQRLNITCTALQNPNTPSLSPVLYTYTSACISGADCSVGIKTVSTNLLQEVYPNPSENEIKVVFTNNNDTHTIQLTDLSGRLVKSDVTTQAAYTLEKGNLNAGVYFLKVSNNFGQASIQKIIFN